MFVVTLLVAGSIGGFLSTLLPSSTEPLVSGEIHSTFLGAIAAFLFVVLISNTDKSDVIRTIAISIVAGMAWQPVLVGLRDGRQIESLRSDLHRFDDTVSTIELVHSLELPRDPNDKTVYEERVSMAVDQAVQLMDDITNDEARQLAGALIGSTVEDHWIGAPNAESLSVLSEASIDVDFSPSLLNDPDSIGLVLSAGESLHVAGHDGPDALVRLNIFEAANYTVDVSSDEHDLVAAIYEDGNSRPIAASDDYDGSLNPRIEEFFEPGDYYLHITDFQRRSVTSFEATLLPVTVLSNQSNEE